MKSVKEEIRVRWKETDSAGIVHFTWHDLRHTFANRLVMAGVEIRTVAALMGHRQIQMTMRYAHLGEPHKLEAVEKLCQPNSPSSGAAQGQ